MPEVKGARKLSEWRRLTGEAGGILDSVLGEVYGAEPDLLAAKRAIVQRAVDAFAEAFEPKREVIVVRSAGRVNLLGMHVDHRGGYVNPIAVGEVIFVAEGRDDDEVVLKNVQADQFGDRSFAIRRELPQAKIDDWDRWTQGQTEKRKAAGTAADWSNYVKSAVLYLQHVHTREDGSFDPAFRGMNVMVYGAVPVAAGLSSSSGIVVAAAEACRRVNDLDLSDMELVDACAEAEWYVGTRGGGGDHAAIKFGKLDHVLHIGSFPLSVARTPFPPAYRIVLADSLKKAEKSAGARDVFNQRVACYVFGLMMVRENYPGHAPRLEHLRDLNPQRLGTDDVEIYRILQSLPERARREEILQALPDQRDRVRHVFGSHAAPADGYRIRQACLYGVSECMRSEMAAEMLSKGDVPSFGELINISHDGDRVTRLEGGRRVPTENRYPDARIDGLIADLQSGDRQRQQGARLWRQPGGYDVSTDELDCLVDIARATPGVVGAGLVGAGLGGSVVAVVEAERAPGLLERFEREYYRPRGLQPAASIIRPVGGAACLDMP